MTVADNKTYYYIRLKDSFFDSDEIVILESLQDGYMYSNILLKLYLRSLKDNGRLMFSNTIPYSPQMIASITRHQVGTVERALKIFSEMGLIEVLDSGAIYMLNIQRFIGKSSTEADRQREYYTRRQEEKNLLSSGGEESCKKSHKISVPEIEKELEIDIEKEIELGAGAPQQTTIPRKKPPGNFKSQQWRRSKLTAGKERIA